MSAAALLLGAALLVQGDWGWTCEAPVTLGDYKGSVSREFFPWSGDHSPYRMRIERPGSGDRYAISWTIDPRPEGPPRGSKRRWPNPRKQAGAFRAGPDLVRIDFKWGRDAVAPIWVHYWGDGAYAGADLLVTARMMKRRIANIPSPYSSEGGLASRRLLAALAPARIWTVVVTDSAGKTYSSETFSVPTWREAESAFRHARARIDAMERRYRSLDPLPESDASCTPHEDPEAIVRFGEPGGPGPA